MIKGSSERRAVSPIPSRHPSRVVGSQRTASSATRPIGGLLGTDQDAASGAISPNLGFGKGLWESGWTGSWTALQGLASSVLGVDVSDNVSDGEGTGSWRNDGDAGRKRTRGISAAKKAPATWGPSGGVRRRDNSIGAGPLEARDLAVKAKKTASILESHEGANGGLDVNGNYKRRTSLDKQSTCGQPNEEGDALVYVHHVQASDTLAGVVLKYNCQPAVFRKANRLWPHDPIQIREVVFLPVDACAIKGRPCDPSSDSQPIDLLAPTPETEDPSSSDRAYANGEEWGHQSQDKIFNTDQSNPEGERQPWVHVRWVLLDSSPSSKPVEIARLPRKTLGYFPPRRRRSHATLSSVSTPRGSFDVQILPQPSHGQSGSTMGSPPHQSSNPGSSSRSGSYFTAATSNPLSLRDSVSDSSGPKKWLCGPGGVGTFEVRNPGPAEDSLNSWATKHLPILGIGHLPSSSVVGGETVSYGFNDELASIAEMPRPYYTAAGSGTATPSGGQGIGMGLENAAAAIEGWVRRLAIKAAAPGTPKLGMGMGSKAAPELGAGDSIELLDGTGSDDGRGFEPLVASSSRPAAGGSGRNDHAAMLRGRLGSAVSGAKGKSD